MSSSSTTVTGLHTLHMSECPWYWLRSRFGLPNVDWCEENVCAWATEPANTYSNLAYLIVGALIWRRFTLPTLKNEMASSFGPLCIIMGACSMIYHASVTYFFQVFDFLGMFLYLAHLLDINIMRLGWISTARPLRNWHTLFGLLVVHTMRVLGQPYQALVGVQVAMILGTELVLARRPRRHHHPPIEWRWLLYALALNAIGAAFSFMDLRRIFCPKSHLMQGHALWHVFTALGVYASFRHYSQFKLQLPK